MMTTRFAQRCLATVGVLLATAVPVSAASITVAWDPSAGSVAGYRLRYGLQSGVYTGTVDAGLQTSATVPNLTDGNRYYFAVFAYNASGAVSSASNEVSALIGRSQPALLVLDLALGQPARYLDVAFDPVTLRYLAVFVSSETPRGLLMDVWGSPIGASFALAPAGEAPGRATNTRVAGGGGSFMVAWNDPDASARVVRSVSPGGTITFGPKLTLGALTDAADIAGAPGEDGIGNGLLYATAHDQFVAAWQNAGRSWTRTITPTGIMTAAVALTDTQGSSACGHGRPEIAHDPVRDRIIAVGTRASSDCVSGGTAWLRLFSYDGGVFTPLDSAVLLTADTGPKAQTRIAYNSDNGRFVAVWGITTADGVSTYGQRIGDTTGGLGPAEVFPVGRATDPAGGAAKGVLRPAIAFESGRFLIASLGTGGADGLPKSFYQALEGSGEAVATVELIGNAVDTAWPAVAANPAARNFLVVHQTTTGLKGTIVGAGAPARMANLAATASSVAPGGSVTWTATATGGVGPLEYKFWRYNGTTWTLLRDFDASNAITWSPTAADAGQYQIQVWVRSAGSTSSYEDWRATQLRVGFEPLTSVTLTSPGASVVRGRSVTWSANAAGGNAVPQYQYWLYNVDLGQWTMARDYSSTATWQWTPTQTGRYTVQVWARGTGATAMEVWAGSNIVTVIPPAPVTAAFSANRPSPLLVGTSVTFTVNGSGGVNPLEYQIWRQNRTTGAWTVARPYSTANTYTWTPTMSDLGSYVFQAWVRQTGGSDAEAWANVDRDVTTSTPVITSLAPSRTFPANVGSATTWTTLASGSGTLEYQYWVFNQTTGTWTLARPWSTTRTWTWTPTAAATYTIQVWVRHLGSAGSWEAYRASAALLINP